MGPRNSHVPPSVAVVEAVAARSGVGADELPPLYEAIDPDTLDDLVTHRTESDPPSTGCIRFRYHDHAVRVRFDGHVVVETE